MEITVNVYVHLMSNTFLGYNFLINNGVLMSESKIDKTVSSASHNMAETVLAIMDRLAGKESDLKLSFENLTLDLGKFKTTLNGSIVLDIVYAKETKP